VWGTKDRVKFISGALKYEIIEHIKSNAKQKNIYIDHINGHQEHMHCLISLHPDQTLAKVMQLIKGESSYWINKNTLTKIKFEWADEYYGGSISPSHLKYVRSYIRNQEEHHKTKTWEEEYQEFIKEYGEEQNDG
jgi:REP element-mobilizing transposase RayT